MSPGRARPVFGQASSKDGGGTSSASAGGLGRRSGDSRSVGNGSLVRACARSRSLRDDEENNRLRFGLTASTGGGAASGERTSSCHGAPGSALAALSTCGWSRGNRKPPSPDG